MNGFLSDTNVPSELVRPLPEPKVKSWVAAQNLDTLFISAFSFGEIRKGIALRSWGKRKTQLELWLQAGLSLLFSGRILAITRAIAERWGILDAERQLVGWPLNIVDGIAATALEYHFTVVTRNVEDFEYVGVTIFDPWTA